MDSDTKNFWHGAAWFAGIAIIVWFAFWAALWIDRYVPQDHQHTHTHQAHDHPHEHESHQHPHPWPEHGHPHSHEVEVIE